MKNSIIQRLEATLIALAQTQHIDPKALSPVELERCKDPSHGDFATNIALKHAKIFGQKPRDLAQALLEKLGTLDGVVEISIAGAGFINFRLQDIRQSALRQIIEQGAAYGMHHPENPKKILLEFVSANPNGPLHVGHGRGAAYGASLANVLRAAGQVVDCEYYVNDAGRQMDILALSVYWRYLQLHGEQSALPKGVYQGEYVIGIAENLRAQHQSALQHPLAAFVAPFENTEEQRDVWIDTTIANLRTLLGEEHYQHVFNAGLDAELADIQNDLVEFGVVHERYYSEKSLFTTGKVQSALDDLKARDELYLKDGAWWFKSKQYGDEKDRVVQRENGITTYFASDIAYHDEKLKRGYDLAINIWGADHHGYISRVKAALSALGHDADKLLILLVQFAVLYQGGEKVQMSTRSGQFVTLRDLREQVGNGACRFFYVMRKSDQHLDFDLDLATSNSKDNPYYYVQYAHARTARVLERAREAGIALDAQSALAHVDLLNEEAEWRLVRELERYPDVIVQAAEQYAPHMVINYLKELATAWHQYYDAGYKVLHEDQNLAAARLLLTQSVGQVLKNGLHVVGVEALERM